MGCRVHQNVAEHEAFGPEMLTVFKVKSRFYDGECSYRKFVTHAQSKQTTLKKYIFDVYWIY